MEQYIQLSVRHTPHTRSSGRLLLLWQVEDWQTTG